MASWERGYGDFHLLPDLGDAAARAVARGDGARPLRRRLGGRLAGRRLAAPGARGAGRAGARGRLRADGRLRARVLPPQGDLRRGARQALPRPDAVGAVHPRLPRPRDHLRRGPDPPDPERDAGAPGSPVESSKGEAWPGQHEINFRYADARRDGRQPRDLQERRQGDRERERLLDHVHGEARPHLDRELVPRPREPLARRRERVRRRERGRSTGFLAGWIACARGARALPRAEHQLVQALRRGQLGADDARLGARQPHVRLPRSSGTGRRSGSRRGSRAATSTRTSRSRR